MEIVIRSDGFEFHVLVEKVMKQSAQRERPVKRSLFAIAKRKNTESPL